MTDTMSAATNRRPVAAWAAIALAALFGLLYAYDLWEAISNLASITQVYEVFGLAPTDAPWWLLIAGALVPVVVFGLALWLSRGRGLLGRTLVFTTGLMVVAVVSLDIVALEGVIRRTLY